MRVKYSNMFVSKYSKQESELDVVDFLNEQFPFIDYSVNSAVVDNLNIKTVFNFQKFIFNSIFNNMSKTSMNGLMNIYLSNNQFRQIEKQINLLKISHYYHPNDKSRLLCDHTLCCRNKGICVKKWLTCAFINSSKMSDNYFCFSSDIGFVETQCFKNVDASFYFLVYNNNYRGSSLCRALAKINVTSLSTFK